MTTPVSRPARWMVVGVSSLLVCALAPPAHAQALPPAVRGVDAAAPGPIHDGTTWSTAYLELEDALADARLNPTIAEIWIAAGPYKPSLMNNPPDERSKTFQLIDEVAVYGGFLGNAPGGGEIMRQLRNPEFNETILNGDTNDDDDNSSCCEPHDEPTCDDLICEAIVCGLYPPCCIVGWDPFCAALARQFCELCDTLDNVYNVVRATDVIETAVLNGVTIRSGYAYSFGPPGLGHDRGAGILVLSASPRIVRCSLQRNAVSFIGGAVTMLSAPEDPISMPTLVNCSFLDNWAGEDGGGVYAPQGDEPILINCLFSGNWAFFGGGVFAFAGDKGDETIQLVNCTLGHNKASQPGGFGDGIWVDIGLRSEVPITLRNCILWDNGDGQEDDQLDVEFFGPGEFIDITASCVQGLNVFDIPGADNIGQDPQFCDPLGLDGIIGTSDDNFRLLDGSPSIDTGRDNDLPDDLVDLNDDGQTVGQKTPWDLDTRTRQFDAVAAGAEVDMGAYENQHVDGCRWDTGNPDTGAPPDGMVATQDLLYLLHNWGPCPGCAADFNCDLKVKTADLLELITNWGCCPNETSCNEPLTLAQELALKCLDQDDWNDFMDCLANGTPEEAENCNCWMTHFLEHCSNCFICQHTPECPGPNPFE